MSCIKISVAVLLTAFVPGGCGMTGNGIVSRPEAAAREAAVVNAGSSKSTGEYVVLSPAAASGL